MKQYGLLFRYSGIMRLPLKVLMIKGSISDWRRSIVWLVSDLKDTPAVLGCTGDLKGTRANDLFVILTPLHGSYRGIIPGEQLCRIGKKQGNETTPGIFEKRGFCNSEPSMFQPVK